MMFKYQANSTARHCNTIMCLPGHFRSLQPTKAIVVNLKQSFGGNNIHGHIYISIYFSDKVFIQCPAKNGLQVSKYKNISAGVGDSVARQARDVRSTPAQCWPNAYDVDPPPNQPRPNSPA